MWEGGITQGPAGPIILPGDDEGVGPTGPIGPTRPSGISSEIMQYAVEWWMSVNGPVQLVV